MSGERLSSVDISENTKFSEANDSRSTFKTLYRKASGFREGGDHLDKMKLSQVHLEEMQKQLGNAENRCNTLKEQLDYMKKVCQTNNIDVTNKTKCLKLINSSINKSSDESLPPELPEIFIPSREDDSTPCIKLFEKQMFPIRQNSQLIKTDKSGSAVKAINNILSGITESVNRLSELSAHIDERTSRPSSRRSRACGGEDHILEVDLQPKKTAIIQELPENYSEPRIVDVTNKHDGEPLTLPRKRPRQRKPSKNKVDCSCASLNINSKKNVKSTAKHTEKRIKLNTVRTTLLESTSYVAPQSKKSFKRKQWSVGLDKNKEFLERSFYTDNLVELYHNKAVHQGSDSEDSNRPSKQEVKVNVSQKKKASHVSRMNAYNIIQSQQIESNTNVPPLQIEEPVDEFKSELSPIQETDFVDPPAAPRTVISTSTKNYELPTIASKMKQAAKSYLRTFDFRAIPFCAARSTSPSHNIGINIQQVMNIIKTRQPISGISPTLAHNIGLAAEKLNSRPLSAFVSSLGSRVTFGRSQCPLLRQQLNYQQLQEMAKEIPEEDAENAANDQNSAVGGGEPQGSQQGSVWTIDPSTRKTCTCYSQQGLGFQQVLNRYQSKMSTRTGVGSQLHYKLSSSRFRMPRYLQKYTCPPRKKSNFSNEIGLDDTPLQGREKTLKDVLQHLHDDFEHLNKKYDELSKKLNEGGDHNEENVKELEKLEKDLGHKEEEINMVMALYKEVTCLKEQVKTLKEKASQASVNINPMSQPSNATTLQAYHSRSARFREVKDSNAALHLTKLLRQIQTYQETLKKEGRF